MERFKNILLVAEENGFTSESFAQARVLADRNVARLTVMDVVDELPHGTFEDLGAMWSELRAEQIRLTLGEHATETLPITVSVGVSYVEIIRTVVRSHHDLVVIPDSEGGYSSTTLHLLRKCPVPVWVMKPGRGVPQRILAAVDPAPDDPTRESLNVLVLDLATSLTRRNNGELTIVHTWVVPGESTFRNAIIRRHRDFERRLERARRDFVEEAEHNLESLLEGYELASLSHRIRLVHGIAGHIVPKIAAEDDIDLLVMGTVARVDVPGLFIGRNAEMIIQKVDRSILAVKPRDFKTPVLIPDL